MIVLYAIILTVFAFPATLMVYTPWRIAWRGWLIFAVTTLSFFELTYIKSVENFTNLSLEISLYFFGILSPVLIIRGLYRKFIKKRSPEPPSKAVLIFDKIIAAYFGLIGAFFIIRYFCYAFMYEENGFFLHYAVGAGFTALTGLFFIILMRAKKPALRLPVLFCLSACLFSSIGAFAGSYYPQIVLADAKEKAGDRPYCIALRNKVTSHEDLTLFTMPKSKGSYNAAMLVEDEDGTILPHHWSHWAQTFYGGMNNWRNENRPTVYCKPRMNFAESLAQNTNDTSEYRTFYLQDKFIKIPSKYYPSSGTQEYFSVYVIAPDFKPNPAGKNREPKQRATVQIKAHYPFSRYSSKCKEPSHDEFIGTWNDFDALITHEPTQKFFICNSDKTLKTTIQCYKSGSTCYHEFYTENKLYRFKYNKTLLPEAQEMEGRLFHLFQSFGVE